MTLVLRTRSLPKNGVQGDIETVRLYSGYDFAATVRLIDEAMTAEKRFAVRTEEQDTVIVDPRDLQTLAVRRSA